MRQDLYSLYTCEIEGNDPVSRCPVARSGITLGDQIVDCHRVVGGNRGDAMYRSRRFDGFGIAA